MKRTYTAPRLELEVYKLNVSIASNCNIVVHNGPVIEGSTKYTTQCSDYYDPFATQSLLRSVRPKNVSFYDESVCDCYTTGGNGSYWTS